MTRPQRLEAAAVLDALTELVAERVLARLAERTAAIDPDPIVPLRTGLGVSARKANAIGRAGTIEGASKCGRTWVARRSRIDAWLETQRPAEAEAGAGEEMDDVETALAAAGWGAR